MSGLHSVRRPACRLTLAGSFTADITGEIVIILIVDDAGIVPAGESGSRDGGGEQIYMTTISV